MTVFDRYSPLGLGTSRFPVKGPDDIEGIEKSALIVSRALEAGVNYIDTSYTYSAGQAPRIIKEAFARTGKVVAVTLKVMHSMDKTADDARRRAEMQLTALGLSKTAFFVCWTITSYHEFVQIMRKGGVYDGAVRLKNEGIIDHICCSIHAPSDEAVKIITSGAFEGATLSYNLTNVPIMADVLDAARKNNVGIAVMNPLGGGLIAENPDFFSFARANEAESVIFAAMRFVKTHPAVDIVLSGVSSENELEENLRVFGGKNTESDEVRFERVSKNIRGLKNFCTGCGYCDGCPVGIPTSDIMKMRNKLLFGAKEAWGRNEPRLVENINLFRSHIGDWIPETPDNPCVKCGACEIKCTQKLGIIDAVADMYERAAKVGFSLSAHKARLYELLHGKSYKKVGLYPNGGFANLIREQYEQFWGTPDFEWFQFNSDPKMWGQMSGGLIVRAPSEILNVKPDIIIVCTYKYDKDIYAALKHFEDDGIKIVKLHRAQDVPWVF
jgi:predicted aldo/keto reductase-like oxidoreductase